MAQNQTSKDKFLILAFPVNKVIQDVDEAKLIIKNSDLKAKTNQEIFLEAEFSQEAFEGRKTMFVKSTNRIDEENSIFASAGIQLAAANINNPSVLNETANYSAYDPSVNSSKIINPQNELEETKRQIEELKKSIQNHDSEISKLNVQLNNYSSNSMLFKTKNKGKNLYFINIFLIV